MRRTIKRDTGAYGGDLVDIGSCKTVCTVLAVRLGAKDVVALAKFYDAAFGLKEIDSVGKPPTEIIMRYGATVAAAKAGASPEFLLARRDSGAANDPITHAMFHVSDISAAVLAAKAAARRMKSEVASVTIGGMALKTATLVGSGWQCAGTRRSCPRASATCGIRRDREGARRARAGFAM